MAEAAGIHPRRSVTKKRAHSFPLLLYHFLSTRTPPFWTIFFGVLSPILKQKRRASCASAVKALIIKEGIAKGGKHMSSYVLGFQDVDKTKRMVVGGKGANLGELSRIEGIRVPDGFCLSTEAFQRIIGETPSINELLDRLSLLKVEDRDRIAELSAEIRRIIEGLAIPQDIQEEIARHLSRLGEKHAYAI